MQHRPRVRILALVMTATTLTAAFASALPTPTPTHVTIGGATRVGANVSFLVGGIVEVAGAAGSPSVPLPDQPVAVSVDGVDRAQATTKQDGHWFAVVPGLLAGPHTLVAHSDALLVRTGESAPFAVLAVLPPAMPLSMTGGPGRHTGDVTLQWTPAPADPIRPVDAYLVERREGDHVRVVNQVPSDTTSVGDVRMPGSVNQYRVGAVNLAGTSEFTPWIDATAAMPPPADLLSVATSSVDVCHLGRCENLGWWDDTMTSGDDQPVYLYLHFTGKLTNHGAPVDLEPFNGSVRVMYDDRVHFWNVTSPDFGAKTATDGSFDMRVGIRVPNVAPGQPCLRDNVTAQVHYPGVAVAGGGGPDVRGQASMTVFLC